MEIKFWKDKESKIVNPELFSKTAEELAKKISNRSNDRTNTPTQIRKFYDEVLRFNGIIRAKPEEFEIMLPYIKMLNAKAAYAHARESSGRPLISEEFKNFIYNALSQVNDREDFEVFTSFFEAFIGFYKYYFEEKKKLSKEKKNMGYRL
jgi:CRISPR-associated protein Csm2